VIKAVLVDFDGTLADTQFANYKAYSSAINQFTPEIEIDFDTFLSISDGRHWSYFLPKIYAHFGQDYQDLGSKVAQEKTRCYPEFTQLIQFNESLISLLKVLKSQAQLAIVTTASKKNVLAALSLRDDVKELFEFLITSEDVEQHKPHPEAYEMAAKRFNVVNTECLIFEDSKSGIESAERFGGQVIKIKL